MPHHTVDVTCVRLSSPIDDVFEGLIDAILFICFINNLTMTDTPSLYFDGGTLVIAHLPESQSPGSPFQWIKGKWRREQVAEIIYPNCCR